MRANSQASFNAAADRWEAQMAAIDGDLMAMVHDMLGITDVLDANSQLRRFLTDPAGTGDVKAAAAERVFAGKVAPEVIELFQGMVRSRWSEEGDLAASIGRIAAFALLGDAEKRGTLKQVAEELFSVEELLSKERQLRDALSDRRSPDDKRLELVETIFGGRVGEHTMTLLRRMVVGARHPRLIATLRTHARLAAERRDRVIAVVTAAVPLTQEQLARVARILETRYGRKVQINVSVDPEVVGGMRIAIGDDVMDGTISTRLDAVRARFSD